MKTVDIVIGQSTPVLLCVSHLTEWIFSDAEHDGYAIVTDFVSSGTDTELRPSSSS